MNTWYTANEKSNTQRCTPYDACQAPPAAPIGRFVLHCSPDKKTTEGVDLPKSALYKRERELYSKRYFSVSITSLSSSRFLLSATTGRVEWGIELAAWLEIGHWHEDTFADVRLTAARMGLSVENNGSGCFVVCSACWTWNFQALMWSNLQQTKCRSPFLLPFHFSNNSSSVRRELCFLHILSLSSHSSETSATSTDGPVDWYLAVCQTDSTNSAFC